MRWTDKRHDDYLRERELLVQGELDGARSLDKYLVTLAAGSLVLSVTFLEKIAPEPVHTGVLCLAWGALIVSLVLVLVSFLLSQCAFRKAQQNLDRAYNNRDTANGNFAATLVGCLNVATVCAFAIGIIMLTVFGWLNLKVREKAMTKNVPAASKPAVKNPNEGAKPPKAPVKRPPSTGKGAKK